MQDKIYTISVRVSPKIYQIILDICETNCWSCAQFVRYCIEKIIQENY